MPPDNNIIGSFMTRVSVKPELLTWARERAGLDRPSLVRRFPKLSEWEDGKLQPTLRQVEDFAHAVHVAIGYLFLPKPPDEPLPIPDFRTLANREVTRPGPNLVDTIYLCQQRQDWFRDYARVHALSPLTFINSVRVQDSPENVAEAMRQVLGLSIAERQKLSTWADALRQLLMKVEDAGILMMASSIVGSNSHRKLDVEEFRGFALADDLAPLIFINSSDSKAAQMFTIAHELAHLWLGESGISDPDMRQPVGRGIEHWCNAVAAELLVPLKLFWEEHQQDTSIEDEIQRLARIFKVSTLVILRRLFDAKIIDQPAFWKAYQEELNRILKLDKVATGGGNFYSTLGVRTGKRFARAVISSTLEGQTLFLDAFRLLGVRKKSTFDEAARGLGAMR